jgi:antitoxin HigA-1
MARHKPIYTGLKLLPMETGASRSRSKTDRPTSWIMRTTTKMAMHNPPHPGEFIIQVYLDPNNLSGRELAGKLGVAASTLNRILTATSRISPEMALRLSKALGRSPESWLAMQYNHDLWQAKQHVKLGKVGKVRLTAA